MFGIGTTELMVILVVALIVVGPKKLPQIARTLGKAMGEFKRVSTDLHRTINTEIEREEKKDTDQKEVKKTSEAKAPKKKTEEEKKAEDAYKSAVAANTFPAEESQDGAGDTTEPAAPVKEKEQTAHGAAAEAPSQANAENAKAGAGEKA